MQRALYIASAAFFLVGIVFITRPAETPLSAYLPQPLWEIRSVDTMKFSRDVARERLNDEEYMVEIDRQVANIASASATHIAIGTPYDEEFLPYLTRWVKAARKYKLKIWFRGNFAGWEEWFGYPKISRDEHKSKLESFIKNNPALFQDGDIFSACPECENGGPGDPRNTGDTEEHRQFLIDEYRIALEAFKSIGVNVDPGFHSMNYDVARLVMDTETTRQAGGIVTIDHYVRDPIKLAGDVRAIAVRSNGKVFLGEFGAPIPDIHGVMTEVEQAKWIGMLLSALEDMPELKGLNYWTAVGGSTGLWLTDGTEKQAVSVMRDYYAKVK